MTKYFEATNQSGTNVQINDTDFIYSLAGYGSFSGIYTGRASTTGYQTLNGNYSEGTGYYYKLPMDTDNKIVYVYNPSTNAIRIFANHTIFGISNNGGVVSRTERCIIYCVVGDKSIADNLQYVIFKKTAKTAGNCGLNVFDANSNLIFSSNDKNLSIKKASFRVNGPQHAMMDGVDYTSIPFTYDSYENSFSTPIGANFDIGTDVYGSGFPLGGFPGYVVQSCLLGKNYVKMEAVACAFGVFKPFGVFKHGGFQAYDCEICGNEPITALSAVPVPRFQAYDCEICGNSRNYSIYSICDLYSVFG
jgi:hypothetical protein